MKNVVITGVGIKSCIGNSYGDVLESLKNGKSGIISNSSYADMGFRSQVSGSMDIDFSKLIDRKLLRFMGESARGSLQQSPQHGPHDHALLGRHQQRRD